MIKFKTCLFCKNKKFKKKFEYYKPIPREIKLKFKENYYRFYKNCIVCGHFFTEMKMNLNGLYDKTYVDNTYGDRLHETFKKIISLPKKKSDNYFRVKRIQGIAKKLLKKKTKIKLLDIGSGLGVFPYQIKKIGWDCTAIDPDKNSYKHMKYQLNINCKNIDFDKMDYKKKFNIVTLNKVLEHVSNPIKMLKKIKQNLISENSFFYIEVPDASEASKVGKLREEFGIDHLHVFTMHSLYKLIKKSKFTPISIQRIKENSTKFTLIAVGQI